MGKADVNVNILLRRSRFRKKDRLIPIFHKSFIMVQNRGMDLLTV